MLEVQISDHIEPLVGVLADHLDAPLDDPFQAEWVAVPSIGMRRWLAQRLSRRLGVGGPGGTDGISANIDLPFPAELRRRVLAADAGDTHVDPWEPERLVWAVFETLSDPDTARHAALRNLTERPEGGSLVGRALALADLLDRYALHRPAMIRAWADGQDVDALGEALGAGQSWQPGLFRAVRDRVGVPAPPERLDDVLARLAAGALSVDLPDRLFMFGMSTLPPDVPSLLRALSGHRDVHVLMLGASTAAATSVGTVAANAADGHGVAVARRSDPSVGVVRHPLLRSWGSAGREAVAALAAAGVPVVALEEVPDDPDDGPLRLFPVDDGVGTAVREPAPSLLERVQLDLRSDRPPDGSHVIAADDTSVQVHACTGATRQVEVLRDAVLHRLAADPTLVEGDVVVLCPQIETFAPVIEAVLGPSADAPDPTGTAAAAREGAHAPLLRYRITDRRLRADVQLLGVVGALLELLPGRFAASEVADFLALAPVRDRFGLSPEDLDHLDDWIGAANIRWGIDGPHRVGWDLPADFDANSWSSGMDQLLMGTAVRADDLTLTVGQVAPLAVADGGTQGAARVAEAVRTLAAVSDRVVGSRRTVDGWCEQIALAVDELCSLPPSESWQRRRLDRVLQDLRDRSTGRDGQPSAISLDLGDVRRLLVDLLGGEPSRAAFGTGTITFCSLSPLRSVPARVVCILGLDQDALPRGIAAGDDLLAAAPAVGDRDPRAEARQLLLEALLAAGDALVVTCGAADVRTNLPVPPAVVLDELWDTLADTCGLGPDQVRDRLRADHPRQGFAPENFADAGLGGPTPPGPWGFDPLALTGARALRDRRPSASPDVLIAQPLGPVWSGASEDRPALALDRIRRFASDPVLEFFTERLGVWFPRRDEAGSDHLPARIDALARHWLGVALLEARSRNLQDDDWLRVVSRGGALPPGELATAAVDEIKQAVQQIVDAAAVHGVDLGPSDRHEIDIVVGGRRILGVVGSCGSGPRPGPVALHYSRQRPKQRINATVDLLALTAMDPEPDWRAVSISRSTRKSADVVLLRPIGDDADDRRASAVDALDQLVQLRDAGLCRPLPIFEKTSRELALGEMGKARQQWSGRPDVPGEGAEAPIRAAFGDVLFDDLLGLDIDGRSVSDHARDLWAILHAAVEDDAGPGAGS